jgi:phage terminase large subunit-like protein
MILTVPQDVELYPTLGPQVCDFIEQNLVFGPGDLRGKPVVLDEERIGLIYRLYEVYPRGHAQQGRRRFKRCGLSLPKGLGKTELAAFVAACELHPDAPVRCVGWSPSGEPIGGPVTDPYIPMVAYNEQQSADLAYGALRIILEEGPLKDEFDIGLERIMRKRGDGKAESLATSPNARDGARTTFSVMDETHRLTLQRLKDAHQTMLANNMKRKLADPWMLEITTAPEPGAGSVAQGTMEYAEAVEKGTVTETAFFFFHRQAGNQHDLTTTEGARAAVIEASGPAASWRDIDGIVSLLSDPGVDRAYWERVWCNRLVKGSTQAFDVGLWQSLKRVDNPAKAGDLITLGFDGAMFRDSTGIVATHIATGFQWVPGVWERPASLPKEKPWQVPVEEVDALVRLLFAMFTVWRMYADPPYWQSWLATWAGDPKLKRIEDGKEVETVIEWWTNRRRQMTAALENFTTDMTSRVISHDGDARLTRHLGNSRRHDIPGQTDEQDKPFWLIQKERPDSSNKIDLAMAAVLSWEARTDAIAAGASKSPAYQMVVIG